MPQTNPVIVRGGRRLRRRGSKRDYKMRRIARIETKRELRRELETKIFDGYVDAGTAGSIFSSGINFMATSDWSSGSAVDMIRGTGIGQYIGSKIKPVALVIRYIVLGGDTSNVTSIMVIQAKGNFIVGATAANQYQLSGPTTTLNPISAVNQSYNDRYRILTRHIVTTDSDDPITVGKIMIKGKRLRTITFNDGLGSVEANPIFISVISDSAAAPNPSLRMYWRLYYKDA